MNPKPTINIIGRGMDPVHGYGLVVDARIIGSALGEAGFEVFHINSHFYWGEGLFNDLRSRAARELQGLSYRLRPKRDVNIFLERIPFQMFPAARCQVLVPNQEWFPEKWKKHLQRFDAVVCKTHAAEAIFTKLGCRTYYSSFTSDDKRQALAVPKKREFLMVLGKRTGIAEPILALWARHPEWPCLTLCGHRISDHPHLPNVRLIRDYIPDAEVLRMQNEYDFHLAVTASEGFGHKLNEGMSCGAIVITTDAPPMNELIAPDRGMLVGWNRTNPKALGTEYHFDERELERVINQCLDLKTDEIEAISGRARAWYETNDRFFKVAFPRIVRDVLG